MTQLGVRVVGIGASAGGLDAFQVFFKNMPDDSGLAFVVLLHLPPDRPSMLVGILARWTNMRVVEAVDGCRIEADVVYVPPPHAIVALSDGHLSIRTPSVDAPRNYRPIDAFFDSLDAELRENAIGIILSGTGNDGSLGLKAIKECGGLTIAQASNGHAPEFEGMPSGAIATGVVDLVVPVNLMPGHLMRLKTLPVTDPVHEPAVATDAIRLGICDILRSRVGHDFSGYKDKTFLRRVQRRMHVLNISDMAEYMAQLERDHDEVRLLFRDLLIRVTSFFRDADTFETLERVVMPRLFAGRHADSTVRVWVPGCATGEEAYSIAMLLREYMDTLQAVPKVQVFATDIDEPAIGTARQGRYPATLLEGLSPERRERFFRASSAGFEVSKEIRELCTFSPHSIVRDPPFSRMHLNSCRNLLIYMDVGLQADVIPAFHYALAPNGILLLGSSESTSRHDDLFEPLDKAARIFRRRDVRSPPFDFQMRGRGRSDARPEVVKSVVVAPHSDASVPAASDRGGPSIQAPRRSSATEFAAAEQSLIGKGRSMMRSGFQAVLARVDSKNERQRREFLRTRQELQSVTEEHSTAIEELKSANEELHSVNEELQSTNEELETSKEEIQSVNEELHTVNARLSEKVDELDRANNDLRNLFTSTEIATIFLDRHLIIRNFTPAVGTIYNLIPSDQGRPLTDIVNQLQYDRLAEDVNHVVESRQPLERRITHKNRKTHYIMRILPYRAPDSSISGTLITFVDVTGIVQAEQHQRLLVDELNHRVKNMLTVVSSLAAQTLRRSQSLAEFSSTFMGRVRALTASYALLSGQNWLGVSLRDVLTEEVKAYATADLANIEMQGPEVRLGPAGALAIGMAIHELATNAVKYGALSVPVGRVNLTWRLEACADRDELVIEWAERDGPHVQAPMRRGFGTTLIERGFAHELSGSATLAFDVSGIHAVLRAPVKTSVYDHKLDISEKNSP